MKISKKILFGVSGAVAGTGAIAGGVAGGIIGTSSQQSSIVDDSINENPDSNGSADNGVDLISSAASADSDKFLLDLFVTNFDNIGLNDALSKITFNSSNLSNFSQYENVDISYKQNSAIFSNDSESTFILNVQPKKGYSWKMTNITETVEVQVMIAREQIIDLNVYNNNISSVVDYIEINDEILIKDNSINSFIDFVDQTFVGVSNGNSYLENNNVKNVEISILKETAILESLKGTITLNAVPINGASWTDTHTTENRIIKLHFTSIKISDIFLPNSLNYTCKTYGVYDTNDMAFQKIFQQGMYDFQEINQKTIPKFVLSSLDYNVEITKVKYMTLTSQYTAKVIYEVKPVSNRTWFDGTDITKEITVFVDGFKIVNYVETEEIVTQTDINHPYLYINESGVLYGVKDLGKSRTSITIPKNVTSIFHDAFADCVNLQSVVVEEGSKLTKIEARAFKNTTNLQTISNLPSSLIYIGESAFEGSGISYIYLPEKINTLSNNVFKNCVNLKEIITNSGIGLIGNNALENTAIEDFDLSQTKSIGAYAFYGCKNLKRLNNSTRLLNYIGSYAFAESGLLSFDYQKTSIQYVYEYTFSGSDIQKINFSDEIISFAKYAVSNANNLIEIVIPNGTKEVVFGEAAFSECDNLQYIKFPENMSTIPAKLLMNNPKLKNFGIPRNVTSIGNRAFANCKSLTDIYIPTFANTFVSDFVFEGCESLNNIIFLYTQQDYLSVFPEKVTNKLINHMMYCEVNGLKYFPENNYSLTLAQDVFTNIKPLHKDINIVFSSKSLRDWAFNFTQPKSKIRHDHYKVMYGEGENKFASDFFSMLKPIWGWYDAYEAWSNLVKS